MNPILSAYLECALWSSIGDDCEPLDKTFTIEDFHPEAVKSAQADIDGFLAYCAEVGATHDEWSPEQLGCDFWLTRNGHGAGFWDRGLPEGDDLTKAAKTFGSSDCYVGDDGNVYLS